MRGHLFFRREYFGEGEHIVVSDRISKALILGYMKLGGIQMQITCTSVKTLTDAYENPEMYKNLVVRVGGYSEYFSVLSDELKKMIINRTIQKIK